MKEARVLVTSAVLSALKELVPSTGLSATEFADHAPPWMTIEIFSKAAAPVDLVRDGLALRAVLRRLCHERAWGTDFGAALRWLRAVRPPVALAGARAASEAAEREAFEELGKEFAALTLAAIEAGHTLRRHLRDDEAMLGQIRETLGDDLAAPILEFYTARATSADLGEEPVARIQQLPVTGDVSFMEMPEDIQVVFVADAEAWASVEPQLASASLLAVDTEWWDSGQGPALLQVAIGDERGGCAACFLLDTLRAPRLFAPALLRLARRTDVQILGWSFGEDQKRLQELFCMHSGHGSCRDGPELPPKMCVLDLQPVCCRLLNSTSALVSLGSACAQVLGRPLDKAQQCSDWRRRPLSEEQATYAALDAVALLMLRAELSRRGLLPTLAGAGSPPLAAGGPMLN